MESENTNLSCHKANRSDSGADEDESNSEEYETDSSSNSGSEEHEAEADKSRSNYYQKKILRNRKEQQEIMKLIQLSEAKQDFATALDEIKPKKKTLNRKEKIIHEGPIRKSDRHKDRKRKNLSVSRLFARAFSVESEEEYDSDASSYNEKRCRLFSDFLIPALNHKTYGDILMWDPLAPSCFLLRCKKSTTASSFNPEHYAVFADYEKIRGRRAPKNRWDYLIAKKRMTVSLYKSKKVKRLKRIGRYRRFKILDLDTDERKINFEFNCPTKGDENIPLALKEELKFEKRKRNLQRRGKDTEWDSSGEEDYNSSDEEEDMVVDQHILHAMDNKNARRSSRLKDTKVNYSVDDLFSRMYGATEREQSQTEENDMTVSRIRARDEKFYPNGTEFSEWPKVLLHRLQQSEISKYCEDVDVCETKERRKGNIPKQKLQISETPSTKYIS